MNPLIVKRGAEFMLQEAAKSLLFAADLCTRATGADAILLSAKLKTAFNDYCEALEHFQSFEDCCTPEPIATITGIEHVKPE